MTPNPYQGGIVPMTVEPLHQFERGALSTMAAPPAYGQGSMVQANQALQSFARDPRGSTEMYTNPMATGYLGEAGGALRGASAPITMADIEAFRNPYAGALKGRLTEQGEQARAAILANQGVRGARSFRDTSQGVRQGMLEKELVSKGFDIDFQTYESAIDQINKMRDRQMQGGAQFGALAGAAQGVTNSAFGNAMQGIGALSDSGMRLTDVGRQTAKDQLGAGQYIREYNQGVNDMIGSDILSSIQDDPNKMTQVLNWLKSFESNTSSKTGGGANTLQQVGDLATGAGGLLGYLNTPTINNLPWTTPGNTNPTGGFYS